MIKLFGKNNDLRTEVQPMAGSESKNVKSVKLNKGKLEILIPEECQVLTAQDYLALGKKQTDNEWAIRNDEKHYIIEIAWKKVSFLEKRADLLRTLKRTEPVVAKQIPSYKLIAYTNKTLEEKEACGLKYSYEVSGIKMLAEYVLVKHDDLLYSFHFMSRDNSFDDNYTILEEVLNSAGRSLRG